MEIQTITLHSIGVIFSCMNYRPLDLQLTNSNYWLDLDENQTTIISKNNTRKIKTKTRKLKKNDGTVARQSDMNNF